MKQQPFCFIVDDCDRCHTRRTGFDVLSCSFSPKTHNGWYLFSVCRSCHEPTLHIGQLSSNYTINGISNGLDMRAAFNFLDTLESAIPGKIICPEFVPDAIRLAFDEAATCLSTNCIAASGAMFRRTIDLSTRTLVNENEIGSEDGSTIKWKVYKDLKLRLDWLISNGRLSKSLLTLADCVREDGNDAAHSEDVPSKDSILDLQDFTVSILEAIFTEPGKLNRNIEMRQARRGIAP